MDNTNSSSGYYSPEDLRNILRQIWSQYSLWTRFYTVSKMADLGDIEVVTNRLYEVPMDFSNVLKIYYDNNSIQQFENLLREQITLTIQIIDEIIAGQSLETTETNWKGNAYQLSLLLSRINPYWNLQTLQSFYNTHLDMIIDETEKRNNRQYAADVYAYTFIEYHTLMIADYMWNGILNQFYPKQ